jgi:hypothetical protein
MFSVTYNWTRKSCDNLCVCQIGGIPKCGFIHVSVTYYKTRISQYLRKTRQTTVKNMEKHVHEIWRVVAKE